MATGTTEPIITVNGEEHPYRQQSIHDLLQAHGIDPERPGIAVAVNASIVHHGEWVTTQVQPGDRIEIVRATAGG